MRATKLYVIGLALAGLAGCGTALAAEHEPVWVAPASSTPATVAPAPAASSSRAKVPARPSSPPATSAPATSAPATSPPASAAPATHAPEQHGGPANSLMVTGQKGVALTFDDGPDPEQTPKLLDLLAAQGVKATFCVVGENVQAHPDLVRRIAAEGHTLCNHTWDHDLKLGKKKPEKIHKDLARTNDAIWAAVPDAEIAFMRAPGGNFTPAFVREARKLGMASIYWQVDTRDWDHSGGESPGKHQSMVIRSVKKHVSDGAIVLSHDYAQPDTIKAYEKLIPWLKKRFTLIAL